MPGIPVNQFKVPMGPFKLGFSPPPSAPPPPIPPAPFVQTEWFAVHKPPASPTVDQTFNPNLYSVVAPTNLRRQPYFTPKRFLPGLPAPPQAFNPNLYVSVLEQRAPHTTKLPGRPFLPVPEQAYNQNLYTAVVVVALPFNQHDWSNPFRTPDWLPQPQIGINPNIFTNPLPFNHDAPVVFDIPNRFSPDQALNINIFTNPIPFNQVDWSKPVMLPHTTTAPPDALNINLFTNPIPFDQMDYSHPVSLPRTTTAPPDALNINLFTNPYPFNQYDWSKPKALSRTTTAPPDALNPNLFTNPIPILNIGTLSAAFPRLPLLPDVPYNQNLYTVVVVAAPFVPIDIGPARGLVGRPVLDQFYNQNLYTVTVAVNPFTPSDFFVARTPRPAVLIEQTFNPNLFTNPLPFNQTEYPLQVRLKGLLPVDAPYNQGLYTVTVVALPFASMDVPRTFFPRPALLLAESLNPNVFTNPYPFNQYDFAVPRKVAQIPVVEQPYLQSLFQVIIQGPFVQTDWSRPFASPHAPIDPGTNTNYTILLPAPIVNPTSVSGHYFLNHSFGRLGS